MFLPRAIQVGGTVNVAGRLEARIKPETGTRGPWDRLAETHKVQLIATVERTQVRVPEFHSGTDIVIDYPVYLEPAFYNSCVLPGDKVKFFWGVSQLSFNPNDHLSNN